MRNGYGTWVTQGALLVALLLAPAPARSASAPQGEDASLLAALPDRIATLRRQGPARDLPGRDAKALLVFARPNVIAAIALSTPMAAATTMPAAEDGPTSATASAALARATGDASLRVLDEASRRARSGAGGRPRELRWRSFIVHDGSATDLLCNRTTLPSARRLVTEIVCVTGVAGRMMTVGLTITHDRQGAEEAIRLACRFASAARASLREAGRIQRV